MLCYEGGHALEYEGGADDEAEAKKDEADAEADAKADEDEAAGDVADAKAALDAAKNWRSKLPAFLQTKPGEVSALDSLTAVEYRSATWMCFMLAIFNVMSGVAIMLVYFGHIFNRIDGHKQEFYTLS